MYGNPLDSLLIVLKFRCDIPLCHSQLCSAVLFDTELGTSFTVGIQSAVHNPRPCYCKYDLLDLDILDLTVAFIKFYREWLVTELADA